jgi:hypothetical protein
MVRLRHNCQVDVEPLHHLDQPSLTRSASRQIGFGGKVGHKMHLELAGEKESGAAGFAFKGAAIGKSARSD